MSREEDKNFATKDPELAAFLKASDIKLVDVRKNEYQKAIFVFDNADGRASKLNMAYLNHEDTISASKLFWSFSQIKQLIFDQIPERPTRAR